MIWAILLPGFFPRAAIAAQPPTRQPLFRVVDLNVDESQEIELADGARAKVTLLAVEETRDKVRSAIRLAKVKLKVNGVETTIESGRPDDTGRGGRAQQ